MPRERWPRRLTFLFAAPYENYLPWAIWLGWGAVAMPFIIAFLIPQRKSNKANEQ